MLHRSLFAALVFGFLAVAVAPCQAQGIYFAPSNIHYDAYGQGYYGGFGQRANGLFPGSNTTYGTYPFAYNPNSSRMFPRNDYRSNGISNYRGNVYSAPAYTPPPVQNWNPGYNPYGYSSYGYNPYYGW